MTTSRTTELMNRLPRWFVEQAQQVEQKARRRREAQAKLLTLEFLCAVEVRESAWDEWQDTLANSRGDE